MKIKKSDLTKLIESYLLEEKDKKVFKGTYYTLGSVKGVTVIPVLVSGITIDGFAGKRYLYLLPKGSENKNIEPFKRLTYEKYKDLPNKSKWTQELDEFSDYSQNVFFKHLKSKRISYGNSNKAKKETSGEIKKFEDTWLATFSDTAIDSAIAITSLFPATAAYSSAASLTRAAEKLAKQDYPQFIAYLLGAIPGVGGPARAALQPFTKTATKQAALTLSAHTPSILVGISQLVDTIKEKKIIVLKLIKEIRNNAVKASTGKLPHADKLFDLVLDFFEKLVADLEKAKK